MVIQLNSFNNNKKEYEHLGQKGSHIGNLSCAWYYRMAVWEAKGSLLVGSKFYQHLSKGLPGLRLLTCMRGTVWLE